MKIYFATLSWLFVPCMFKDFITNKSIDFLRLINLRLDKLSKEKTIRMAILWTSLRELLLIGFLLRIFGIIALICGH
jgi:hypothetical protein